MMSFPEAIMTFWQKFGMPVFHAGCVDDQTAFPYITIDLNEGDLMRSTILTATSWHRRAATDSWTPSMRERLDFFSAVSDAIPKEGVILRYQGGYAILNRNSADWLSYVTDNTDPDVIGGRVAYEVRFFNV